MGNLNASHSKMTLLRRVYKRPTLTVAHGYRTITYEAKTVLSKLSPLYLFTGSRGAYYNSRCESREWGRVVTVVQVTGQTFG